jgi:hypothetical protein
LFLISTQNSFVWTGTCSSVSKSNAPVILMLNTTLYTCSIDLNTNIMKVVLYPSALAIQTSFRFQVGIINPPIVVKNVDIVVRAVK